MAEILRDILSIFRVQNNLLIPKKWVFMIKKTMKFCSSDARYLELIWEGRMRNLSKPRVTYSSDICFFALFCYCKILYEKLCHQLQR